MDLKIEPSWQEALQEEFNKSYFKNLTGVIKQAYLQEVIYPHPKNIFNAFTFCPFNQVKVVILGQDPYHGEGQAHGLSFSVPDGIKIPPSLLNIYKELKNDIGKEIPTSGNLEHWTKQGALLLNATLTVRASEAGSHQGLGWETFTDTIIKTISDQKEHVVFILWGKYAGAKAGLINKDKHLILTAPHPSPFSAYTGFFGSKPFSKTNEYLEKYELEKIEW
ncbi:MAG: uracil-DNA glycosylase [Candidatus Pacebacteria bacterium]|nr:uracil-DNA glycosylase [Candidatus Paceibacterota bacterium]